jgi:hypothetical protein
MNGNGDAECGNTVAQRHCRRSPSPARIEEIFHLREKKAVSVQRFDGRLLYHVTGRVSNLQALTTQIQLGPPGVAKNSATSSGWATDIVHL